MEQIETQASDLRYLAQAPALLNNDTAGSSYETPLTQGQHSPGSASVGDNSATPNPNKRKSIDDGYGGSAKQTRSKRNRYISIACNECKRRKIKCNGETPCQRCGNLNLTCLYTPNCCSTNFKDSDEFKTIVSQLGRLQDEVNFLNQSARGQQPDPNRLNSTSVHDRSIPPISSVSTIASPQSSSSARGPDPSQLRNGFFRGPTSMAFSLDVANSTIANMGYKVIGENEMQQTQTASEDMQMPMMDGPGPGDPLLDFDKDEMIRLCRVHEEEVGIMYPVLNIQTVIGHVKNLTSFLESMRNQRRTDAINDDKTLQVKLVMCCGLVVEEHGHSERAVRLFESMESVLHRKLMGDASDIANLPILALLAGYRFLSNDEVLAWRVMGQVVRLCVELGIHQRMGLMKIQDEQERKDTLNSFWSAYVLDRRWAFGTGLPYAIQDDDIDSQLPLPENYPFLIAMINYSKICSRVWRQISYSGPVLARELHHEELERLDQEILQWYETVPEEVKVRNWHSERQMTSTPSYNLQRLRIWTYLRLNQVRIWLYTPILHSATSIMANPVQAQRVVDLSKDTIRYLNHLNSTTNLYRRIQVFYHQFLTSAISVVFLASVHAPVRFSAVCREEFYLALELVKDLSTKSYVSQRLWKTIRTLKDVAPRFGLNPEDDAHSTAALGMIGLARGHLDNTPGGQNQFQRPPSKVQQASQTMTHEQNGSKIQSEMSRIFEGYVGLNGVPHAPEEEMPNPDGGGMYTQGGTVFPHLREMF